MSFPAVKWQGECWEKILVVTFRTSYSSQKHEKCQNVVPAFWYRINQVVLPTKHSFYSLNTATETTIVFIQIGSVKPRSQFLQI